VRRDAPAAVAPHDRFILRSLSPMATIGGGTVLDALPRRWHERGARVQFLAALNEGDMARAALALAAARAELGLGAADLAGIGLAAAAAAEVLDATEARGELESLSGPGGGERRDVTVRRWFVPGTLAKLRAALAQALARRAQERPDRPFVTLAELATATPGLAAAQIVALLAALPDGARVVEDEGGYALEGAGGALGPARERLAAAVLERMTREPFAPPTLAALAEQLSAKRRSLTTVLEVLVRRGELVRVKEDLWFARVAVDAARERLLAALAHSGQITLAEFRDLVDTGRRNAQALLESFDREGLTRRRGDVRVPRTRRP
jgi:selenocysteine-specific elongation factor